MKSKLLKLICLVLAVCIVLIQTSCSTLKSISYNDIPNLNKKNNYLVLNTSQGKYNLFDYSFENDTLKGKVFVHVGQGINSIYVYTPVVMNADSLYKNHNYFRLGFNDITKLEYKGSDPEKTTDLIIGIVGTSVLLLGIWLNAAMKGEWMVVY